MTDSLREFEREFNDRLHKHVLKFLRDQEFPSLTNVETEQEDPEASERYCGAVVSSGLVVIAISLASQRGFDVEDIERILDDCKRHIPKIALKMTSPGGSG
jgi:hypothetical protein